MIYLKDENLPQVEYLIALSKQGRHVLFDEREIRLAFLGHEPENPENIEKLYSCEHHLERVLELETFSKQKAYIGSLDKDTLRTVIVTYFNVIEHLLLESKGTWH